MTQNKQRHAIYVAVRRKHPDWPPELVKKEVDKLQGSHKGSQIDSQVHIPRKPESPENTLIRNKKGSHDGSQTGSQSDLVLEKKQEHYLLSYSRNKYQFVLYSVDTSGRKSLIKSCRKNDILKLGPCEIQLTWGPDMEVKE